MKSKNLQITFAILKLLIKQLSRLCEGVGQDNLFLLLQLSQKIIQKFFHLPLPLKQLQS